MKGIQIGILVLLFVIAALLGALIFQQSPKVVLVRLHAADGQKIEISTAPHEHTAKSTVK